MSVNSVFREYIEGLSVMFALIIWDIFIHLGWTGVHNLFFDNEKTQKDSKIFKVVALR